MADIKFTTIVRDMSAAKFSEILSSSTRQAREAYFQRHHIRKPKKTTGLPRAGAKNEARTSALYEQLATVEDHEMVEEILRTWLLTRRELLSAGLDHLKIEHDNGLTESDDIEQFTGLKGAALKKMLAHLCTVAPEEDAHAYLRFMGVALA